MSHADNSNGNKSQMCIDDSNKKTNIPIYANKYKSKNLRTGATALYKNKSLPSFMYRNPSSKHHIHQTPSDISVISHNNKLSKSNIANKTLNQFDPKSSPFYPKNFNEYRHLSNPSIRLNYSNIKWSIELRGYPKLKYQTKEDIDEKYKNVAPPNFYEDDIKKFKSKYKITKIRPKHKTNFNQIKHLTNSNGNHSVSLQLFNFYTTLRDFKPYAGVFVNEKEWKNYTGEQKRPNTSFVKQGTKNERYIMRPYLVKREKVQIGKDVIYRKRMVKNKNEATDWFGEHNSCPEFVDTYNEKNFSEINNYLCEGRRTVSQCMFELGLRGNYRKIYEYKHINKNNQRKGSYTTSEKNGKGNYN